jgi:hypothetical protein
MRYIRISLALLLATASAGPSGILPTRSLAQAGTLRIALLANTQVNGDAVLLADFLPPHVSTRLRATAQSISLGASPQIGSIRRFSRTAVLSALQSSQLSQDSFLVPELLTAHRASKFVTEDDVFSAIQSMLAKNPNPRLPTLRSQDVTLESHIEVPEGPTSLEVTQMIFDQSIQRARFRLSPRNAPGTLPFYATASIASEHPYPAAPSTANAPSIVGTSAILVDPRQLARLHLHSANSNMFLVVRPLERGRLNETIRVRLAASGRTLQAKVIAANSLDATF